MEETDHTFLSYPQYADILFSGATNNGRRLALYGGTVTLRSDNRSRETGKRNKPDQGGKEG